MIRSVRLERLPEGIVFPAELAGRISFASDTHELRFEGFMSKTDFDKLLRVHNDLAYQRALEHLFQKCVFRDKPGRADVQRAPNRKAYLGIGAAVAAIAVGCTVTVWMLGSRTPSPTPVATPPPQISSPVASQVTTEVNHVSHVVHKDSDSDQQFDGEIKP